MTVVLNYGMGVDSSVIVHRVLTDPSVRDFPLSDLIVLSAQTGDEFPDTKRVVETHMLPLLRKYGVRYVQVARKGPAKADGIGVLSDTRKPSVLHTEGIYRLSEELQTAGTIPPVMNRECSMKSKGVVNDTWLAANVDGAFRQLMGFNADEEGRIEKDSCYGGDNRNAEYPLMQWGWGREVCEQYLRDAFGIEWPKSCCSFCPFTRGKPPILARYREMPSQAAQALMLEHVSMAMNPRMTLYVHGSLMDHLVEDGNGEAVRLFEEGLGVLPFALYRVRRLYKKKGDAARKVEVLRTGTKDEVENLLQTTYEGATYEAQSWRAYLRRREPQVYPTAEDMVVAAPALTREKCRGKFDENWTDYLRKQMYGMELPMSSTMDRVRAMLIKG